jgi:hypothetical protein
MAQWWACDKSCGYVSGNFDEVVAHEQYCQHRVQTIMAIPPPAASFAPAPQNAASFAPAPQNAVSYAPAPQNVASALIPASPPQAVDLWKSVTTMEDYIRRQQVDLARLWEENQALRQSLQALSWKYCEQEKVLHSFQTQANRSNAIRRPVEADRQLVVQKDSDVSVLSVDPPRDTTVNHLWI